MSRITITLFENERRALQTLAERELRNPRDQAALIVRTWLEREGYLTSKLSTTQDARQADTALTKEGTHANING